MDIIQLLNVTKTFGQTVAVKNLSLDVPRGSVYGFIGPNGSGKTTTLRMIMNILLPDSGTIKVFGEQLVKANTNRIGYMPEERGLYTRMKVNELLEFYGRLKGGRSMKNKGEEWLAKLDLEEWANKKLETLSKGMGQKVQFIATIVAEPEIVILDEPFTGLDPVNAEAIKDVIMELQSKGTTIIFSTHDMNMAEKMCDFIFMIFKGEKVLDGTLDSIQDKFGSDTIRIKSGNGKDVFNNFTGIEKVNDFGHEQELRISPDTDPYELVKNIMDQTRINSFDIVKPSLNDIFIRIAGPSAQEEKNA
jgi:ABC-2 type transport system ATP-binding protein